MILVMVVALSSYCQFPKTRVIGRDSVVIMTIQQGREINQRFITYKDSIEYYKKNYAISKIFLDTLSVQRKNLIDSFRITDLKLKDANELIDIYRKDIDSYKISLIESYKKRNHDLLALIVGCTTFILSFALFRKMY
jgi:hypothetical protein